MLMEMIMGKFRFTLVIASLVLASCNSFSVSDRGEITYKYNISFPNAVHNEAEITITLSNLDPGPVHFSMSRSSPGRYALHEFAKNVYNVTALDSEGNNLEFSRPDLHTWKVTGHDGSIIFSYTLYADRADGTYSGINEKHAHLNMPATFIWVEEYQHNPITIEYRPPGGKEWDVATQLEPTDDPYRYRAPDLYYFLDSPTELSDQDVRNWNISSGDTVYTIRLAVHHDGTEEQVDRYAEMAKKVVDEQVSIFGEAPEFDYGSYTFIADYLPYVSGDGMEHRNSTILTGTRSLGDRDSALRNLRTLSHEFFHAWNVERIRPKSLEPFNFKKANVSGALWFGEGFTSYYDDLVIRRAGLTDNEAFAESWNSTLNYVLNSPGSRFFNPVRMSIQAPFVDAATSVDPQNKANTFISYYSWGAVIGLGLDLMMRSEFEGLSLDDLMQAMWQDFGKPEIPYTLPDLENTLAEVTGSPDFAGQFFERYIYDGKLIKLDSLLERAGFLLRKVNPERAAIDWGDSKIDFSGGTARVVKNTLIGSPLYNAGIDRGDLIREMDGQELNDARTLNRVLAAHNPGDTLRVTYRSLGDEYTSKIKLIEDPRLELVTFEQAGREVTDEVQRFRDAWLGSRAN